MLENKTCEQVHKLCDACDLHKPGWQCISAKRPDALCEHCAMTNSQGAGHLAFHCRKHNCSLGFQNVTILGKGRTKGKRENLKALHIRQQEEGNGVSVPSIALTDSAFLQG